MKANSKMRNLIAEVKKKWGVYLIGTGTAESKWKILREHLDSVVETGIIVFDKYSTGETECYILKKLKYSNLFTSNYDAVWYFDSGELYALENRDGVIVQHLYREQKLMSKSQFDEFMSEINKSDSAVSDAIKGYTDNDLIDRYTLPLGNIIEEKVPDLYKGYRALSRVMRGVEFSCYGKESVEYIIENFDSDIEEALENGEITEMQFKKVKSVTHNRLRRSHRGKTYRYRLEAV